MFNFFWNFFLSSFTVFLEFLIYRAWTAAISTEKYFVVFFWIVKCSKLHRDYVLWYKIFLPPFFYEKNVVFFAFKPKYVLLEFPLFFDSPASDHFHSHREFLHFLHMHLVWVKGHWFINVNCFLLPIIRMSCTIQVL